MDGSEAVSALTGLGIWEPLAVALIRHGGRCAYCRRNLVGKRLSYACAQTDHLLPQAEFPELAGHRDNWVLSCSVCNLAGLGAGHAGDAGCAPRADSERGGVLENEADRDDLVGRARSFIRRRTSYGRWEREWRAVRKMVRES